MMLFDFVMFGLPRSAKFCPRACFWTAQLFGTDQCFLYWWVQLPPLLEWVFSAVFQVLDWSLLVFNFYGNVCNWIPKVIWPRMDWFWGFLLKNGFFRWFHICMDWNLQQLLNCSFFWRHQFFSMFSLSGILVCSSKMLVLFSPRFL